MILKRAIIRHYMTARAVIYYRVSDPSQIENNSLETQLTACERYAKSNSFEIVGRYKEEGKSAKHIYTREELSKLIQFCTVKANRIDALIVYNYSRFSRNTEEGLATIALLAKYHVQVISVTENHGDDPMGHMIRTIMIGMAQLDNEMKGKVVKSNMQASFRKGLWPFKCPIGYKRPFPTKEESKGLPPVQDRYLAPIIAQMFKNASQGIYNKAQLARMMNLEGFEERYRAKASHKIVDEILKRTFYYGNMYASKWDEYVIGRHDPLIDKPTWEKAYQLIIMKRKNYKYQDVEQYPLKSKLLCGHCNLPLTTSPSKGRNKMFYYYECRNKLCLKTRIQASDAHEKYLDLLKSVKPTVEVMKLFDDMVFADWDNTIVETQRQADVVESKIAKFKDELQGLTRGVDREILTEDEAREKAREIRKKMLLLRIEKSDIRMEQYNKEIVREFTEHFLLNLDKLWGILDLPKRQAFLDKIFPNGIECNEKREIRTAKLSPSFELIQSLTAQKGENVTPQGIEPWLAE